MHLKPLLLLTTLLTFSSCIHRGRYRTAGSFERVRLELHDARIAALEPRGPFGDQSAKRTATTLLKRKFGKCGDAVLMTEDELAQLDQLPALYGELTDDQLDYFTEHTDLDYLIYTDIGPGAGTLAPSFPKAIPADREASAFVYVYELDGGTLAKTVQVNGSLNEEADLRWYEFEYDERAIAERAMRKALKSVVKHSNCRE